MRENSLRVLINRPRWREIASHIADHLGAPLAVVDVGADSDHAAGACIVSGRRLHRPRTTEASQNLYRDHWPRRGIRAMPYRRS